jgi:hypothetical protein
MKANHLMEWVWGFVFGAIIAYGLLYALIGGF